MQINASSEAKLKRVHPDLVKVVRRSAALIKDTDFGFVITCGARTVAEQRILVAKGASKTMNSRHIPGTDGTSKAVDYAVTLNGKVRWDWPLYHKLANIVKQAAIEVGVPIEWGGDWKSFKDGPHFQLPHAKYP
jgi:peptidoglycan L-alanyl-D-glutamate endopeptidase CwlK